MAQERYSIFYSSRTGNPKMLADAIREAYYRKVLERVRSLLTKATPLSAHICVRGKCRRL